MTETAPPARPARPAPPKTRNGYEEDGTRNAPRYSRQELMAKLAARDSSIPVPKMREERPVENVAPVIQPTTCVLIKNAFNPAE